MPQIWSNKMDFRGKTLRFTTRVVNDILETPMVSMLNINRWKTTLFIEISTTPFVAWVPMQMGRHVTLYYANLNQEARVQLTIIYNTLMPCRHTSEVTRDIILLVYCLMKGLPMNVASVLRNKLLKLCNNKRWWFCYGSLLTLFLWSHGVGKEFHDLCLH